MNAAPHPYASQPSIAYLESSLPLGMTLGEYRRFRPHRLGRRQRLMRLVGARANTRLAAP